MTLTEAIAEAQECGLSFSRRTGRTERERKAGTHMVVIRVHEGHYASRYACVSLLRRQKVAFTGVS